MSAYALSPSLPSGFERRARQAFLLLALGFSTAASVPWLRPFADEADPAQGNVGPLLVWGTIYAVAILALVVRPQRFLSIPVNGKLVWGVVLLGSASALWSEVPATTLRTGGELLLTTVLALFVATRISPRDIVAALSWGLLAIGLASAVVALALPSLGMDELRGNAWSGLFTTKNELGRVMALAVAIWLVRFVERDGRRGVAAAASAFCASLVFLSESKTAFVVLLSIAVLLPFLVALRSRPRLIGPSVALFLVAGAALAYWLESTPAFLARFTGPSVFTGRGGIWEAVWESIQPNFWFGYGLGAFWRGLDGPSALVWGATGDRPPHAHNGFLDLWLGLGLVGVVLIAAALVVAFRRALHLLSEAGGAAGLWPAVFLSFLVLYNVTESTLVSSNSLFWILFCVVAFQPAALAATNAGRAAAPIRQALRAKDAA